MRIMPCSPPDWRLGRWLMLAAILCASIAGCDRPPEVPPPPEVSPAATSASAPDAAADLPLIDLAGIRALMKDASERDRVLVIDFWATWCEPCVQIFPALHEGLVALGEKVETVTITLDGPKRAGEALAFLRKHDAGHGAYMLDPDPDKQIAVVAGLGKDWKDLVVPAILIYAPDGVLAGEFLDGRVEPILACVKQLLAVRAPTPEKGSGP